VTPARARLIGNLKFSLRRELFYEKLRREQSFFDLGTSIGEVKISCCKMKQQDKGAKRTNRRKTLDSLCSTSSLLLSVLCCIALIHVEFRKQEHHRLISYSVTCCDQMETQFLRKVQQSFGEWKEMKGSNSEGHWQETRGDVVLILGMI